MKKTLIAAALLSGFAATAQAQSSVTLYGIVDAGFMNAKTDGQSSISGINSGIAGGSRFGFRGSEDLGNGLKANFQLENGFNVDDGQQGQSGRLFGRQAWVGLSSASLGELRLGRQDSFSFGWWSGAINPFGNAYSQAQSATVFGFGGANGTGDRLDNTVTYQTPRFGGFQAGIGYSMNASGQEAINAAGQRTDARVLTAGARYLAGPLAVVLTYDQKYAPDSNPAATSNDIKNIQVGATYDFGVVKAHAGYGRLKDAGYRSTSDTENAYLLGLTVPFGASSVFATYQRVDNRNFNAGRRDEATDGYAVGYNYKLSKRTMAYALFTQYNDVTQYIGRAAGTTGDKREIAFGVSHRF